MFDPSSFGIFPKCPFHSITGFHCPGCGSQRAIHSFMHGNLAQGFQHNFLILLLLIVVVYDAIVITVNKGLKKQYFNLLHHPVTTKSILVIIILFWILRNVNFYPFNLLSP